MSQQAHMREALHRDGFVRLPGALSPARVDSARRLAAGVIARLAADDRGAVKSNGSMANLARLPEFAGLVADPDVLGALRELGASDPRWTGGYLISKPAGGPPLFWHQDWWAWDDPVSYQPQSAQLFVMIYLTATRRENGCLRVIPGSHLRLHPLHAIAEAHSKALAAYEDPDHAAYASHEDEVAVTSQPGDLLIGDSRLIHGAYTNASGAERPLITLWYAPGYSTLPAPIRARYAHSLATQEGDVRESALGDLTPLTWPQPERSLVAALLPDAPPGAAPAAWRRAPDAARLSR